MRRAPCESPRGRTSPAGRLSKALGVVARAAALSALIWSCSAPPAVAQLTIAAEHPIAYGHHHINATSLEAHHEFWVDTLGGVPLRIEGWTSPLIGFPEVLVFINHRPPAGGSKGTTVNHVGFQVADVRATVARLKAAGFPIITRDEAPSVARIEGDVAYVPGVDLWIAFAMGPDDVKVEIVENASIRGRPALHHVHFAAPDAARMRDWYARVFGAKPGKVGPFEAAELPGVNLVFLQTPEPAAPTRNRVIDHVGFEVKNLESFSRKLEASGIKLDRAYSRIPASGIGVVFLTDPWGTLIELTEGLDGVR